MFNLEAMRQDREAGTPGPWFFGRMHGWIGMCILRRPPGSDVAGDCPIASIHEKAAHWKNRYPVEANARRIARVPDMEAELDRLTAENAALRVKLDAVEARVGDVIRECRQRVANETAARDLAEADAARLREALLSVIETDRHSFYDGPPPRYVQIARAALATPAQHASDCAMHSAPAAPAGPCDCGATPAQEGRS